MKNIRKCADIQLLPASVENDTTTRKRTTKTEKVNHFDR